MMHNVTLQLPRPADVDVSSEKLTAGLRPDVLENILCPEKNTCVLLLVLGTRTEIHQKTQHSYFASIRKKYEKEICNNQKLISLLSPGGMHMCSTGRQHNLREQDAEGTAV